MSLRKPAVVPASRITRPGTPAQVQLPAPLAALTRPVSAAPSLDTPGPRSPGELGKELTPRPASTPYSLTPFKSPSDSGYETKLIGPHADYFGAKPLLQVLDHLDDGETFAGNSSLSPLTPSDRLGLASAAVLEPEHGGSEAVQAGNCVGQASICRDSSISSLDLAADPDATLAPRSLWSSDSSEALRETDSEASFRCRTAAAAERVWAELRSRDNKPNPVKELTRLKRMSV